MFKALHSFKTRVAFVLPPWPPSSPVLFPQRIHAECGTQPSAYPLAEAALQADATGEKLKEFGFPDTIVRGLSRLQLRGWWHKIQVLMEGGVSSLQTRTLLADRKSLFVSRCSGRKLIWALGFLKTFNITGQEAGVVLLRHPRILGCSRDTLERKSAFLDKLGIDRQQLNAKSFVILSPSLDTFQKSIVLLRSLGLNSDQIFKLLNNTPHVICCNDEYNLKRKLAFLDIFFLHGGVSKEFLSRLLVRRPYVLTMSTERRLATFDVLERLGFAKNSKELLVAFFSTSPMNPQLIQARFTFLVSLGFSQDQTTRMVMGFPRVLGKSEESHSKKIKYLVNVLNRNLEEIVAFPAFLLCSLEQRIIPRFNALAESKSKGILLGEPSLSSVLACKDKDFQRRYMRSPPLTPVIESHCKGVAVS